MAPLCLLSGRSRTYFSVLAITLFCCAAVVAQVTSGAIFGQVKDSSGAYISKAQVSITSPAIGVTRRVATSEDGGFVAPNLPPGTYNITINSPGFKQLEKKDVILSATDRLNAGEFVLEVGATAESVTVTADAGELQLQTNSGERSDLVTNKQLNNLALNGRNVLDMMKLVPGVISSLDGSASGLCCVDQFNVNGTRANQHEYTIDGASNVDTGNNGALHVTINPDAISEVKILTSNYQAEFGKAGGGQIIVSTKSGTNQFHGEARFFHRNEGLNANNWFADNTDPKTPIALYRYNYFGYQFGGPVLIPGTGFNKNKNKLFFFWSQEYYRQLIPSGDVLQVRMPTALERQGDFSKTVDGNGNPLTIYNPATGLPFAGNKIDPNSLNPAQQAVFSQVSKVLSLYSLPNISGNPAYNYSTQLSYSNPRREDILRVDYQINDKNRFYGHWINNADTSQSPMETWNLNCMGQLQYPGGCLSKQPSWNVSANLVSTITPTLLNEASIGPSVVRATTTGNNGNVFRGVNGISLPMLYPVTPSTPVPDFSFQGNNNINYPWSYLGANPWFQANTTINFNDNLTKVLNNHTLKAGIFVQRARKDQIAWGNYNGQATFDNCATSSDPVGCSDPLTGNAYASALLGNFRSFDQTSARPVGFFRYTNLEFYAQDTWKATQRLTLDYGLRFAWYQPQYDAKNQLAIFDPASYDPSKAVRLYLPAVSGGTYDPANPGNILDGSLVGTIVPNSGDLTNGMHFASSGYYRGGWRSRGIMPEPRLGFAYELTSDHKTVLRGGAGMMHDRIQGNLIFNPVFNNPANVVTPTVLNGNLVNLPNLVSQGSVPTFGGILGADKNGQVPTIYNFSLGVQREIGEGTTIDVAYVGSLSRHLVTQRDINAIPYGTDFTRAAQDPSKYSGGVVPAVEANLPAAYAQAGFNYSGGNAYDTEFLVPYKGYSNISYYKFDGTSNYNSLQVSVQRRFTKALTFGGAYTWSKAMTTASADQDTVDPWNPRGLDYRAADWDRTHVLVFNYVYNLPSVSKHFGAPKWLSYITDNFQLSGISSFETGQPLDTSLWIPANLYTGSNQWGLIPPAYFAATSGVNHSVGTSKFDPAAFISTIPVGSAVLGRSTTLRGGGLQNWDMSLFKNIPLGSNEQRYLQLRLEAFNIFNHPNFQGINLGNWQVNAPTGNTPAQLVLNTRPVGQPINHDYGTYFGEYNSQYSGPGGPRVLQLAVKLYF